MRDHVSVRVPPGTSLLIPAVARAGAMPGEAA